jgi:hypothetical protein
MDLFNYSSQQSIYQPHTTDCTFVTKTRRSMLCRKTTYFYSENYTKIINKIQSFLKLNYMVNILTIFLLKFEMFQKTDRKPSSETAVFARTFHGVRSENH